MSAEPTRDPRGLASVLVAVFNGQRVIRETLESIRNQSYRPLEVVIVDDGSTDSSREIIEAWRLDYQADDLSIISICTDNRGLLAARNRGLEHSSGEYIQFLDHDDILHPRKLETCIEEIRRCNADVAISCFENFRTIDEIVARLANEPIDSSWVRRRSMSRDKAYLAAAFWGYLSPVFRRSLVDDAGRFPERWPIAAAEEIEFHLRIKLQCPKIAYVDKELAYHRITAGSITQDTRRVTRECSIANIRMVGTMLSWGVLDAREWRQLLLDSLRRGWRAIRYTRDPVALIVASAIAGASMGMWVVGHLLIVIGFEKTASRQ